MAKILDGKQLSLTIRGEIADAVARLVSAGGKQPCLAAVLVGENPASQVYVRNKQKACEQAGIASRLARLPADISQARLLELITKLNADPAVHGILVQLPLPDQIAADTVLRAIDPAKDVDAFHPENVGLMVQGQPRFLPCTPHGVLQMLRRNAIETAGKHAVVIGRSDIVGKPMALLLAQRGWDATVTLAHSRTPDLPAVCRSADLLIAAVGKPEMVRGDWIKPGAAVIDVGINRTDSGLVGDVDYAAAEAVAGWITPVPGGVGPMTIAMLLANTLKAAGGESP
ncbi:bifunctional methylenetetrahydrofolate dehydrogenase/methenyltetrahydrofolate cyclohydrolase FolD [Botrimarina hoheduenensis]|uniref:Bifunctional protein FolD n=1 Tax=Botrimarina hoheduenensis TaxID=2528000 RepID=A0A5C5WFD8_9BACT|nr:bifunctional methylenetetrahydrofolate dehydrogenase/methenyltetrahydrofolate cyclohydrolase FolD [Botrimarina hoheduenensis]TWT48482.1 Tetrahydrofolate dehydrogenase/cyclohydrolase [Botrimarina hoheduenensis]